MSWSLNFIAKDKAHAKEIVAKLRENYGSNKGGGVPSMICDYLDVALDHFRHEGLIKAEGHGHLCNGPGSYEPTTANVSLMPLSVSA